MQLGLHLQDRRRGVGVNVGGGPYPVALGLGRKVARGHSKGWKHWEETKGNVNVSRCLDDVFRNLPRDPVHIISPTQALPQFLHLQMV